MPPKLAPKSLHRCQGCGHTEPKWLGRCPACGEWGTLVEETAPYPGQRPTLRPPGEARPTRAAEAARERPAARLPTGIGELDRVLGGGLVAGSLILLGGDPGVGKSTLLLQALDGLARRAARPVLYVSGEESVAQSALRARRVGADAPELYLHAETAVERILAAADELAPCALAVDSIQTVSSESLDGLPGSIGQVRECAGRLLVWAKSSGVPVVLVGHVTKDGALAGPKTLEHLVDVVLHLEGEGAHAYRILRGGKNRFGSTAEIGVFAMRGVGLEPVDSPSEQLLAERPAGAPGSVVLAALDGVRPLLVEVQALVAPPAAAIGRRTAAGVDVNRLALLLAVLEERAGLAVLQRDVFVNVAGGLRLSEPAADLGVACAVASAERRRPAPVRSLVFGEIGLAGEVRGVPLVEPRLAEAAKLGFERVILPRQNLKGATAPRGLELVGVDRLGQAITELLD